MDVTYSCHVSASKGTEMTGDIGVALNMSMHQIPFLILLCRNLQISWIIHNKVLSMMLKPHSKVIALHTFVFWSSTGDNRPVGYWHYMVTYNTYHWHNLYHAQEMEIPSIVCDSFD